MIFSVSVFKFSKEGLLNGPGKKSKIGVSHSDFMRCIAIVCQHSAELPKDWTSQPRVFFVLFYSCQGGVSALHSEGLRLLVPGFVAEPLPSPCAKRGGRRGDRGGTGNCSGRGGRSLRRGAVVRCVGSSTKQWMYLHGLEGKIFDEPTWGWNLACSDWGILYDLQVVGKAGRKGDLDMLGCKLWIGYTWWFGYLMIFNDINFYRIICLYIYMLGSGLRSLQHHKFQTLTPSGQALGQEQQVGGVVQDGRTSRQRGLDRILLWWWLGHWGHEATRPCGPDMAGEFWWVPPIIKSILPM